MDPEDQANFDRLRDRIAELEKTLEGAKRRIAELEGLLKDRDDAAWDPVDSQHPWASGTYE